MGLVSDKNFIVANAVENILAGKSQDNSHYSLYKHLKNCSLNAILAPKLQGNTQSDYLKKKTYGKVPQYLQKIKNEIEDEYQLVREMQIEEDNERDRQKFLLDDKERSDLINALKKKWEVVHREYQTLTHKGKLDTLGIKNKKENCEKELAQLEKDIAKLSKNFIFVDTTMQAY